MEKITLKHLRYFDAVCRYSHFGKAADACSISQPALSMQIKELEEILGVSLFERNKGQVKPTNFGVEFSSKAQEILRSVSELAELPRAMNDSWVGQLRIGIIPTIAPYILPKVIRSLSIDYPSSEIHIRETLTQKLIEELLGGRLDVAIVALPISEPALTETLLFTEEFVLIRSPSDDTETVPLVEELATMRLLLLEEGHCFRDQALSFCNLSLPRPKELLDGSSLSTLVQMVSAGIGITLIPEMAIDIETRSADVSVSRFPKIKPQRKIGMVWRKSHPLASQLTKISELVKNTTAPD